MKRFELRRRAREDFDELASKIADHNEDAAIRFMDAVEQTCQYLSENPQIGTQRFDLRPELRSKLVIGFERYLILYIPSGEGISIVRIVQGSRDLPELLK